MDFFLYGQKTFKNYNSFSKEYLIRNYNSIDKT